MQVPQLENSGQESQDSETKEKVVRRSPDATFYHPAQPQLPMLVVEIAHSQSKKDLAAVCES